jgi:hypothetical protein
MPSRCQSYKRTQFPLPCRSPDRRRREPKRAKQTQFRVQRRGGQVLYGKRITRDSAGRRPRKNKANFRRTADPNPSNPSRQTNPIWRPTFKLEVASVKRAKPMVGTSNFTLYTSHSAEGRSCETKPIECGKNGPQVLCSKRFRRDSDQAGLRKNKANFRLRGRIRSGGSGKCGHRGKRRRFLLYSAAGKW